MSGGSNDLNIIFDQINQQISEINTNYRGVLGKLDKISDKQSEQAETLSKNTATLEYHVKRTDLLEEKVKRLLDIILKAQNDVDGVKDELDDISDEISTLKVFAKIIKPTKEKIKWIALVAAILGGTYTGVDVASENSTIKKAMQSMSSSSEKE